MTLKAVPIYCPRCRSEEFARIIDREFDSEFTCHICGAVFVLGNRERQP